MQEIIESIRPVVETAQHVSIDDAALVRFAGSIREEELEDLELSRETLVASDDENDHIAFSFVLGALNFCFWGSRRERKAKGDGSQPHKWTIDVDGKRHDGSYALTHALLRGIREGYSLLDPRYLAELSRDDFAHIVRGAPEIPLFAERVALLRVLGQVTCERFGASFRMIFDEGGWDAVSIVRILVREFPEVFNDEVMYKGNTVKLYKRVQLVPSFVGNDLARLGVVTTMVTGLEQLTGPADYKVPHVLHALGIMRYDRELEQKIQEEVELPAGSEEEVEIRALMIEAVERIAKHTGIMPFKVQQVLWLRGQKPEFDKVPYHHTRTIWY